MAKKLCLIVLLGGIYFQFSAQSLTKRLYVQFDLGITFSYKTESKKELLDQYPEFNALLESLDLTYELRPIFTFNQLEKLRIQTEKKSNSTKELDQLGNTFCIVISNANDQVLDALSSQFNELSGVKAHYFSSLKPITPPSDIPPATTDFYPEQGYVGPDPGVNMEYAWGLGVEGANVRLRDVEYGVNLNHEELSEKNISISDEIAPEATEDFTEHGTAAIGIVISDEGDYGVAGMQYGLDEVILFPEYTVEFEYDRVHAVTQAVASSDIGDVIMYEMQTFGLNDEYVLAEYEYLIWELTKVATDAGVVVVAAAGNGDQNLDNSFYNEYNSRDNSGAIIVGAGTGDVNHERLYFSTYGSRVDVQGWGENVIAPGYGDSYQFGGDFNQNYTYFSGTSSATPIVTSCAIALQSYYFELTGEYLTSQDIRSILVETGIPQGGSVTSKKIGPLPNMEEAFNNLNSLYVSKLTEDDFMVFPNPASDYITITTKAQSTFETMKLTNALGEVIFQNNLNQSETIDLNQFESGIYFIQLEGKGLSTTKKIVKR